MLQPLGLLVQIGEGVAEVLEQEGLDQAVAAHQAQGLPAAALGQRGAVVGLVVGEAHLPQSPEHPGDRAWRHGEVFGKFVGGG